MNSGEWVFPVSKHGFLVGKQALALHGKIRICRVWQRVIGLRDHRAHSDRFQTFIEENQGLPR
jgi:hypothetical protein